MRSSRAKRSEDIGFLRLTHPLASLELTGTIRCSSQLTGLGSSKLTESV
jgi:hypothetical protein